jgi:hypothetical protein
VKEQLSDRLMDDDDVDASEISIEVKNGEVTLTGTVNSREEKRAAEEIAEQSPGVREVQNLCVCRRRPRHLNPDRVSRRARARRRARSAATERE